MTAQQAAGIAAPLSRQPSVFPAPFAWAAGATLLLAFGPFLPDSHFFADPASYLPLHTALEFISIAVAAMVFALSWNLRGVRGNGPIVLLGAALLYVALVDFAHTLSYRGMPDFVTPSGPEKAINFWLAGRLGCALGLLGAAFVWRRAFSAAASLGLFAAALLAAVAAGWVGLYQADLLPRTFLPDAGLTTFKVGAEYFLASLFAVAALAFHRRAHAARDGREEAWLAAAAWTLALSGLFFTVYREVTDFYNLLGHIYKAVAYWMIYRALYAAGVLKPYRVLLSHEQELRELVDQSADELKGERERLQLALEAGQAGTYEWNPATRLSMWSKELLELFGHTPESFRGRYEDWAECVLPEDLAQAEASLQASLETGSLDMDYRIRHRQTGEIRWMNVRGRLMRDAAGKPARLFGIVADISERKRTEERLALHSRRQALLLDIESTMLREPADKAEMARIIFDKVAPHFEADICLNYRLLPESQEMELVAGFGLPEPMRAEASRLGVGQAFCGTVASTRTSLAADRERIASDERGAFVRVMGVRAYACHPLYNLSGQVIGTFALASTRRDAFTSEEIDFIQSIAYFLSLAWERKRAELEIQRLNSDLEHRVEERTAELAHANEALILSNLELQRFAYVAAHDLQTPLRSIAGFTQLLQRHVGDRLDAQGEEFIRLVVDNTRRMRMLIDDLLAYSRLEAQARSFEMADLDKVVDEVRISLAAPIAETGARITSGRLPSLPVDRTQIAQVFANLIENGIKYNRNADIHIHIDAERRGTHWVFSVRDNGIGIDPEYHEKIFDIFKRLHTYHAYPGSGVGLAICRRVVERHGGRIWVESTEGAGSTFRFTLPDGA